MKKIKKLILMLFLVVFAYVLIPQDDVMAYTDFTGNAKEFYELYGADNMKFFPTATDNGKIYFCSRGKTSGTSTGTKFRTVGWQFCLTNTSTGEKGYLYYERDGELIEQEGESIHSSDGYTYNLYWIELKKFKRRLSSSWLSAFTAGEVDLKVNACMTTVVNGVVKGSIDDDGNVTGTVYKTYHGIAGAADWTSGTKTSLKTYFNKTIDGLFHKVTIVRGTGISSTTGAGTYLYGTKIPLNATIASGYQWNTSRGSKWTGNDGYSSTTQNPYYTVGDHDVTLNVGASKNQYTIYFQYGSTVSSKKLTVSYGSSVTLATVAECGFTLAEGYTYDTSKTWAVIRGSDDSVYCSSKGWVTSWRNGATSSSDWSKYKNGYSFSLNSYWINGTGDAHGDDTFTFVLQTKRTTSVKVVFHKNYPGAADETYTETYHVGVANQKFGMNLTGSTASWVYWNKSPEGYYLPSDTSYGGGWSRNPNASQKGYSLEAQVSDTWIKNNSPEVHLYMVRPVKSVTVTFHKNDGSGETYSEKYTYAAGKQNFGMYLPSGSNSFSNWKRSGYVGISGWSESSTATKKHYNLCSGVGDSWINQNCPAIDLYAVWGNSISIMVNPNGGTWNGSNNIQQYTKEKGEVLALPYPSRTGYTFLGWTWSGATGWESRTSIVGFSQSQTSQTGTDAVISYKGSGRYTNYQWTVGTASASDAWNRLTAGTYAITAGHTYRISGEIQVNAGSPTGVRVYHGAKENDYQNEKACYYAGSGWQSFSFDRTFDSAGTGYFEFVSTNFKNKTGTLSFDLKNLKVLDVTTGSYMTLDQVCSPTNGATNITVTASWKGNDGIAYRVHHYLMNTDGSGYSFWKSETGYGTAGSTLYLGNVAQTPEGFLSPESMVVNGQNVSSTTIQGDGSTEIYLYYDRQRYTLTINAGTGILSADIEGRDENPAQVYYGASVTINAETKAGYTWDNAAGWTGTFQAAAQKYSFTMPAWDVTLTAQASIIYYDIVYHLDGGTVTGNPTTYTVEDRFTLKNPTKGGYDFQGWTGSNGEVQEMEVTIEKGTTGNLEFYANWENLEYYLAVNGFLNGTDNEHLLDNLYDTEREQIIGTFDVWIQKPGEEWSQDAAHVTEYSRLLPYGTNWKIENIEGKVYDEMFYTYDGVKMGESGDKTGVLEGTISETTWVVPVFTSWHKLSVGGYCDKQTSESIAGYGTFDISIIGENALGQKLSEIENDIVNQKNSGDTTEGNDVTYWEGYYPYNSVVRIFDIRKDATYIEKGICAEILYDGLYEMWTKDDTQDEGEEDCLQGTLITTENVYDLALMESKNYLLGFTYWYETILDQQGATVSGTEEIWHTFSNPAYYKKAGEKSALETIVIPQRFGFVFQGYFTEANGEGIQYIDQTGHFLNDLYTQKKNHRFYAYWSSQPPIILAYDSYYSLEEAQNGKITEEELLTMAQAWDAEEGELHIGNHSGTIFGMEGFDGELFLNLEQGAAVPVVYVAQDQAGNICRQTANVYVVDTTPQILTISGSKVRFISKEYLECPDSQGGLMDQSIWKTEDFYEVLWHCVNN